MQDTQSAEAARDILADLPHHRQTKHRYSIRRAIQMADIDGKPHGLEGEVSAELAKRSQRHTQGILIPHDAPLSERRSLNVTTGTGAYATVIPPRTLVDALRPKLILAYLGARIADFGGRKAGKVQIPVKSAASTVSWVGDGGAAGAESNMTVGQATLSPNTATAYTDVTRRMLSEGAPGFSDFVEDDLVKSIAVAVDAAALNGSGASNQPLGLCQLGTIPVVTFTADAGNGGAPDWKGLCAMESSVGTANGDAAASARLGWATSPQGRSVLRRTPELGTAGVRPAWRCRDGRETLLGRPAAASTNVPSTLTKGSSGATLSGLLFGNWDDCLVDLFPAVEVLTNPYLQSVSGIVRVSAFQDVDVTLLRPASFAYAPAMITT